MKNIIESFNRHFDDMETTKDHYGYLYHITEIVMITILGTFCGLKSLKQIHQWAIDERTRVFLRELFKITEIPSYSWFTQILGLIKPESFNERFISWAFELVG